MQLLVKNSFSLLCLLLVFGYALTQSHNHQLSHQLIVRGSSQEIPSSVLRQLPTNLRASFESKSQWRQRKQARQIMFSVLNGNFNVNQYLPGISSTSIPAGPTTTSPTTTTPTSTPSTITTTPTSTTTTPTTTTTQDIPTTGCYQNIFVDPNAPIHNLSSTNYPNNYTSDKNTNCTYYLTTVQTHAITIVLYDLSTLDFTKASLKLFTGNSTFTSPSIDCFPVNGATTTQVSANTGQSFTVQFLSEAGAVGRWSLNYFSEYLKDSNSYENLGDCIKLEYRL